MIKNREKLPLGCTLKDQGVKLQVTSLSLTSMYEHVNDDEVRCAESWALALISELSQIKKKRI